MFLSLLDLELYWKKGFKNDMVLEGEVRYSKLYLFKLEKNFPKIIYYAFLLKYNDIFLF